MERETERGGGRGREGEGGCRQSGLIPIPKPYMGYLTYKKMHPPRTIP